jgi:hypothetical protein
MRTVPRKIIIKHMHQYLFCLDMLVMGADYVCLCIHIHAYMCWSSLYIYIYIYMTWEIAIPMILAQGSVCKISFGNTREIGLGGPTCNVRLPGLAFVFLRQAKPFLWNVVFVFFNLSTQYLVSLAYHEIPLCAFRYVPFLVRSNLYLEGNHNLRFHTSTCKLSFPTISSQTWNQSHLFRSDSYWSQDQATLMYGSAAAWLNVADLRKLNGFQNRCLCTIWGVKPAFISTVSNANDLETTGQKPLTTLLKNSSCCCMAGRSPERWETYARCYILSRTAIETCG